MHFIVYHYFKSFRYVECRPVGVSLRSSVSEEFSEFRGKTISMTSSYAEVGRRHYSATFISVQFCCLVNW